MRYSTLDNSSLPFFFSVIFWPLPFPGPRFNFFGVWSRQCIPTTTWTCKCFYQTSYPQEPAQIFPMTDSLIVEISKELQKVFFFFSGCWCSWIRESKGTNFCTVKQQHKELNALILFPGNSPWFVGCIKKKNKTLKSYKSFTRSRMCCLDSEMWSALLLFQTFGSSFVADWARPTLDSHTCQHTQKFSYQ